MVTAANPTSTHPAKPAFPKGLVAPPVLPPVPLSLRVSLPKPGAEELRITRLTHASVLLQWGEHAILTDPWFSQKPLYHHGESLPATVESLPRLTAVLSSMDHYDHFDIGSFAAYADPSVPLLTIAGSKQARTARRFGFVNTREIAAGEAVEIGHARLHAFAANGHPASAFRYEQSYVIEAAGRRIFFSPHFPDSAAVQRVKTSFPDIDIALLGINGLRIKPLLGRQMSMDPHQAAAVCDALQASLAIPIHYAFDGGWISSTFLLSHKGTPESFAEAVRRIAPATSAITLTPGQTLIVEP